METGHCHSARRRPLARANISFALGAEGTLLDKAAAEVRDQFTTVQGVSEIFLGGYVEPALRVDVDADQLMRLQLTVDDVVNSIQSDHREDPAGRIENAEEERPIRVMGEATSVEEFKNVMIKRRAGSVKQGSGPPPSGRWPSVSSPALSAPWPSN